MLAFIKKALGIVSPSELIGKWNEEAAKDIEEVLRTPLTSQSDPERRAELLERYKE